MRGGRQDAWPLNEDWPVFHGACLGYQNIIWSIGIPPGAPQQEKELECLPGTDTAYGGLVTEPFRSFARFGIAIQSEPYCSSA